MERNIITSMKELCGKSKKSSTVLERIIQQHALNKTGKIDYNAAGMKYGVGFVPCSDKFVDNFILRVLVADYLTENKKYFHLGAINTTIRALLARSGLTKYKVKAIVFCNANGTVTADALEKMPFRNTDKETPDTAYYYQEYKVSCADLEYGNVLQFLRKRDYNDCGLLLKDVDVTMDYAGSFNREDIVNSMVQSHGFRCQGTSQDGDKTILDNCDKVGENCLTYMETIENGTTRCKLYNKMVQMLECKGVRDSVGCHWKDWVSQDDTRLARARDESDQRGLTRAEVTFYCVNAVPNDEMMQETLARIVGYVDRVLVYSTPYASVWKSYCYTVW